MVNGNQTEQVIDSLFSKLDNWSLLPAYQLERRADIFFALYLKEALESRFNRAVDHIIPEFPVRKGDIDPYGNNQSFKIDYIAVCKEAKMIYFIELKTTQKSKRSDQDKYLVAAKENYEKVINGIRPMQAASKEKAKYDHLLGELTGCGLLIKDGKEYVNGCPGYHIEILYILPGDDKSEQHVITFQHFYDIVAAKEDLLSRRFAQSLKLWILRNERSKSNTLVTQ